MNTDNGFEPEITTFTCFYCAYMAADTAGLLRVTYPASTKIIKLPCTGKVDVEYILKAFEQGADGVLIAACPIGNCHHGSGNIRATKRLQYAQGILQEIGLEKERLAIAYMSGSQAHAFAQAVQDITEAVRKLGPSPLKKPF